MDYPAPPYGAVAAPVAATSIRKIILIVVCVVVGIIIILVAIGIALGVGLGVGLSRRHSDSSSASGTSSNGVLPSPTVTCTYNSSGGCGCAAVKPSFASSARIYRGYTAVAYSWPWIVALFINNDKFCGGFLVDFQHVVTAAHCVVGITPSTITVYAGIQKLSASASGQSSVASAIDVHSDYSSTYNINDIAVLTLATAFNSTTAVATCCITGDTSLPSVSENGVTAGWGETSSSTSLSDDLLQAVIRVQPFSSCSVSEVSTGRFCAGYQQTSPCFGDSGTPFMTSVNNAWTCTGVVSTSAQCGGNSFYTRVSSYKSFIDGITAG